MTLEIVLAVPCREFYGLGVLRLDVVVGYAYNDVAMYLQLQLQLTPVTHTTNVI